MIWKVIFVKICYIYVGSQSMVEAMEGSAYALGPAIGAGIYEVHTLDLVLCK